MSRAAGLLSGRNPVSASQGRSFLPHKPTLQQHLETFCRCLRGRAETCKHAAGRIIAAPGRRLVERDCDPRRRIGPALVCRAGFGRCRFAGEIFGGAVHASMYVGRNNGRNRAPLPWDWGTACIPRGPMLRPDRPEDVPASVDGFDAL